MTTKTNGKFNSRAVAAMHLNSASRSIQHVIGPMAGIIYRPEDSKAFMRRAIEMARAARVDAGIYKVGDFHRAVLV